MFRKNIEFAKSIFISTWHQLFSDCRSNNKNSDWDLSAYRTSLNPSFQGFPIHGHHNPQLELHLWTHSPDFCLKCCLGRSCVRLCPSFASQPNPGWIPESLQLGAVVQEAQSTEQSVHLCSQRAFLLSQHNNEAFWSPLQQHGSLQVNDLHPIKVCILFYFEHKS